MAEEPAVNALPVKVERVPIAAGSRGIEFRQWSELAQFARDAIAGGLAPKGLEKPQALAVAIQAGLELGLTPVKAMSSMMVVNGRPTIFGDASIALCMASDIFDHTAYKYHAVGTKGKDDYGWTYQVARKGGLPHVATFTVADAKLASLWGKTGPWTQYPDQMLKARARSFALRAAFPDILGGIGIKEEVEDYAPVTVTQQPQTNAVERAQSRAKELMNPIDMMQESPEPVETATA